MTEQIILPDHTFMAANLMDVIQMDPHRHKDIEVLYILNGPVECVLDKKKLILETGDILFISSLTEHQLYAKERNLFLCIHLNYDMVKVYLNPMDKERWKQFGRYSPQTKKMQKLLNQILNLHMAEDQNMGLLQQSAGYELVYYLMQSFPEKESAGSEEEDREQQIIRYILEHYQEQIQLTDLAEELNLSTVYLSRMFKKVFGVGFLKYLTQFRLNEAARELIGSKNHSILRIAMDNGFPNLQSFNKAFKEMYGETPSKYRAEVWESEKSQQDDRKVKEQALQYLSALQPEMKAPVRRKEKCEISCSGTEGKIYHKIWNKVINVGRLSSLRQSDIQNYVLTLKKNLRFEYIRLWDIYSEELLVDLEDYKEYDFSRMDRIFDFLTEHEIRPYLDLGLKPYLMLQGKERPIIEKLSSYELGDQVWSFIEKFMQHYHNRYGVDEINTWYFEIWFDFRNRSEEKEIQYLQNLKMCSRIIKRYAPGAKIGGLGDGTEALKGKLNEALDYWDFVSVYSYPYDASQRLEGGNYSLQDDMLENRIRAAEEILDGGSEKKELHVSEWSLSVSNRNMLNDSVFKGAYIIKTCIGTSADQVDVLAYWVSSDLYAEFKDTRKLLFGGTGLVSKDGIRKPSYYAFYFLSRLGKYVLQKNENAVVTTDNNGSLMIVCHNCKNLSPQYFHTSEEDLDADKMRDYFLDMEDRKIFFQIRDVENGIYTLKSQFINEEYGSVQEEYKCLKEQEEISKDDIAYLKNICVPHIEVMKREAQEGKLNFEINLKANEIRFIRCELVR